MSKWVRESEDQAGSNTNGVNLAEPLQNKADKKIVNENDQLKKLLGEKGLEIQILRDLLKNEPALVNKIEMSEEIKGEVYINEAVCIGRADL